jgi:two-component system, chemotaxis family, protein-glutamate methylesterase/glutaminase
MTGPRVLIVDDSSTVRMMLREYLGREPGLEIAGAASNGREALDRLEQYAPDVVLLDIDMPVLNGLETLPLLRAARPDLPVIMFSRLTERGAAETIDSLLLGASDYVLKPQSSAALKECITTELVPRLRVLAGFNDAPSAVTNRPQVPAVAAAASKVTPPAATCRPQTDGTQAQVEVLVIASSTGGPRALAELLPLLPAELPVPVLIVQHMPPGFTTALAERLECLTPFSVREAGEDDSIRAAQIWVAPGNRHMIVHRGASGVRVQSHDGPPENCCRPAANVLIRSALQVYGPATLATVLTGMGNDGLAGCEQVVAQGGHVLVQDESTSVVWGMPGQVARAGLADAILPLDQLGRELSLRLTRRRST